MIPKNSGFVQMEHIFKVWVYIWTCWCDNIIVVLSEELQLIDSWTH